MDLPEDWRLVRERQGESYRWPKRRDRYAPYRVFMGTTRAEGALQVGLGETIRENAWGRDRKYVVAFLSSGSPQEPLVEFVAADDYEQTRELVAVIRGSDGGRRMYGAGDTLPAVYADRFRTQLYNERIIYPGVWNKVVVVAREDDARDDAQPCPDPEPAALPDLASAAGRASASRGVRSRRACSHPNYRKRVRRARVRGFIRCDP